MSDNQETPGDEARGPAVCANCGAALAGPFCAACGQSVADLHRPALSLVTDFLDGAIAWDGRFLTTLRGLYARPGRVARDYIDGKRVKYSAPVRIYLIMTLVLFALSAAAGIRPLAIQLTPDAATIRSQTTEAIEARRERLRTIEQSYLDRNDEPVQACGVLPGPDEIAPDGSLVFARDTSINIALFERGEAPEPRGLDAESAACFTEALASMGTSWVERVIFEAIQHPGAYEARAAAIASQAFLFMVAGFALLNLALHPRRRVIEHLIYSLYWHAGLVPWIILLILGANLGGVSLATVILVSIALAVPVFAALQERGFYGSSWLGTAWRMPLLIIGYAAILAGVAVRLILLGAR